MVKDGLFIVSIQILPSSTPIQSNWKETLHCAPFEGILPVMIVLSLSLLWLCWLLDVSLRLQMLPAMMELRSRHILTRGQCGTQIVIYVEQWPVQTRAAELPSLGHQLPLSWRRPLMTLPTMPRPHVPASFAQCYVKLRITTKLHITSQIFTFTSVTDGFFFKIFWVLENYWRSYHNPPSV